jgi:hypothetical protein
MDCPGLSHTLPQSTDSLKRWSCTVWHITPNKDQQGVTVVLDFKAWQPMISLGQSNAAHRCIAMQVLHTEPLKCAI